MISVDQTIRQLGSIISITTAILASSPHPAATQAHTFLAFATLLIIALLLALTVPDHRGRW
jgi:uncharacterized membrane protein